MGDRPRFSRYASERLGCLVRTQINWDVRALGCNDVGWHTSQIVDCESTKLCQCMRVMPCMSWVSVAGQTRTGGGVSPMRIARTAKISLAASNQMSMCRFVAFLLLCALGGAQTAPPSPVRPQPAVNLNDSDNARKARAVLDQTIQSLGGKAYLIYASKENTGATSPLI